MAMVIGPTPPGTGVMCDADSTASAKQTSPFRPSGVRLMPTSMIMAPGLMKSRVINSGFPTAATKISAERQRDASPRVREWATVTVQFSLRSRCAAGRPTICERPTTTAFNPFKSFPVCRRRRIIPLGVQGRNAPVCFWTTSPAFNG